MRTDEVRVALRPRGGLEAVDLGFAMARAWWRPLAASWLCLVAPFVAAIVLGLREHPFWTVLLLWWLRPVFARVPLHVLGRALFGQPVGVLQTARALPGLLRTGLWTSLVTQRLSPARTFLLPVLQLEGLRGAARRARGGVLAHRDLGSAMALLIVGAHLNLGIVLGLLAVLELLVPAEVSWDVWELFSPFNDESVSEEASPLYMVVPALYFAGVSVVEPLLVAGGFGLYVNRRVYLEGWDIDLAFRRLTHRAAALARAALAVLALGVAGAPARAEDDAVCSPGEAASAAACVEQVLAGDDFGSMREVEWWKLRDDLFPDEELALPGLDWLGEALAAIGEAALWVLVGVAVLALAVALVGRRGAPAPAPPRRQAPLRLFGLDLDPRRLPDDPVAAARAAWARGARVEALSLLYRAALVWLVSRGLDIPDSATELECVERVRASARAAKAAALSALTDAWIRARYAGAPPGDDAFEALCRGFEASFGEASS